MYNTEKYIGACLTSILGQTFTNFEVIVVDNGSTDKSRAVVESFIPKFEGRLKISHIEINAGGPSAAHNKGLFHSKGKYIYFVDSDDLIVHNALEVLYKYAEDYNVDVVHMDRKFEFYNIEGRLVPTQKEIIVNSLQRNVVDKPTLMNDDKAERLKKVCNSFYSWPAWHKFVRRDFLIENNIFFPNSKSSFDVGLTIQIVCSAEKLLRIPYPLYVYRVWPDSISHKRRTLKESVNFWTDEFIKNINSLNIWMKKQRFFLANPQFQLLVFDAILNDYLMYMGTIVFSSFNECYNLIENKLKEVLGEDSTVTAYCLMSAVVSKLNCKVLKRNLNQLNNTVILLQANQKNGG